MFLNARLRGAHKQSDYTVWMAGIYLVGVILRSKVHGRHWSSLVFLWCSQRSLYGLHSVENGGVQVGVEISLFWQGMGLTSQTVSKVRTSYPACQNMVTVSP